MFTDLFDYEEDKSKTTADSRKAIDENLISVNKVESAESSLKSDSAAPQDFMVGFAPEDLSFADEPIKAVPLGNFPSIPVNDFEKPAVDGSIVYNSSTTETLSKLTIGTETQLVRSVNNTSNVGKTETTTLALQPAVTSSKTSSESDSEDLKMMLDPDLENINHSMGAPTQTTVMINQDTTKDLEKPTTSSESFTSSNVKTGTQKEIDSSNFKDKDFPLNFVGEPLPFQNESQENLIHGEEVIKIDKDIDFLEKGESYPESNRHSQNYVIESAVQNSIGNTEKKLSSSKTSSKEKSNSIVNSSKNPSAIKKVDKSTQTDSHMRTIVTERIGKVQSSTPGAIVQSVQDVKPTKSLEEDVNLHDHLDHYNESHINNIEIINRTKKIIVEHTTNGSPKLQKKETVNNIEASVVKKIDVKPLPSELDKPKSTTTATLNTLHDLADFNTSMMELYHKYKEVLRAPISEMPGQKLNQNNQTQDGVPTKPFISTTQESVYPTMKISSLYKQTDIGIISSPVSLVDLHAQTKRHQESPGLVILDSKGHSLNSNQFQSHDEDENNDEADFYRRTESQVNLKSPFDFEHGFMISKKNTVPTHKNMTNQSVNHTVVDSTQQSLQGQSTTTTTVKYERRNLPPVLMIDKVEQFNEAAGGGTPAALTEATTNTIIAPSGSTTTTTTTVRTESQTNKKTLPAILGMYLYNTIHVNTIYS